VDEADELHNSESSPLQGAMLQGVHQRLIEGHNHKVIWITNRISEIDPSTLRRFSHSVEFGKFDTRSRIKVLSIELRKRKLHTT
jgi:ATP-dependent 26S proteasome regulatory subunit